MIFKETKFHGKFQVLNSWKSNIYEKTVELLQQDNIIVSENRLKQYIEYLLEDTHYNHYDNVFYEPITRFKFTVNVFSQISYEYVLEHLDEFKVM